MRIAQGGTLMAPSLGTVRLILAAIGSLALVRTSACVGLFADGSLFLTLILEKMSPTDFDGPRWFAQLLTQLPLVAALHLGVRSMADILILHSFGLVVVPAALWMFALWRRKDHPDFWFFLLIFAAVYLNSGFFAIGEYNLAFGLCVASMALLLEPGGLRKRDCALLLSFSALAARSYEAFVYLGPLLSVAAIVRLRRPTGGTTERISLAAACCGYAAATAVAAASIWNPRDPGNLGTAVAFVTALENRQLAISVAVVGAYVILFWASAASKALPVGAGVASIALVAGLANTSHWAWPVQYYASRTICGILLFLMLAAVLVAHLLPRQLGRGGAPIPLVRHAAARTVPVMLFIGLMVPNMYHSWGFHHYLRAFHGEVTHARGFIPIGETSMAHGSAGPYGWGWTNPSLSLLLREGSDGAIILNAPSEDWQPFDPRVSVPDLHGYHMNGGRYLLGACSLVGCRPTKVSE